MSIKCMTRVWEISKHKGGKLLLLLAIADHADDNGVAWPGLTRLAHKTRMSRRHTIRLVQAISDTGELWTVSRGQTSNLYVVAVGLTSAQLRAATRRVAKLGGRSATESIILSPPPRVLEVVTKCHHPSVTSDTVMSSGSDICAQGSDKMSPGSDIAMSPDPSLTVIEPSLKEKSIQPKTFWPQVLADLELQMARTTFDQWLRGTTGSSENGTLVVVVRSANAQAWLDRRLRPTIERTVERLAGEPVDITFQVREGT